MKYFTIFAILTYFLLSLVYARSVNVDVMGDYDEFTWQSLVPTTDGADCVKNCGNDWAALTDYLIPTHSFTYESNVNVITGVCFCIYAKKGLTLNPPISMTYTLES